MAANKPGKEAILAAFLMRGAILLCLLTVPSAQRSAVPMAKAFMPFTRTGNPLARQIWIKPLAC